MPILSDRALLDAIERKIISIDPLTPNNIQPASIDLTLHSVIDIFSPPQEWDACAPSDEVLRQYTEEISIEDGYVLRPGEFVTGYSAELIKLTSFVTGRIFNRNSLVRCGLNAALSAFINPGFSGRKVIVIHNFSNVNIKIRSGMRICQLELSELPYGTIRSFEERHDASKLNLPTTFSRSVSNNDAPIDDALSKFLKERIKAAAERLP